jgi:aryl-alcohol dehydrogenase-like predicted oxidoreductase
LTRWTGEIHPDPSRNLDYYPREDPAVVGRETCLLTTLVDLLTRIAERTQATPAQVALAWLLAQKPWIVPIPGTTKRAHLHENLGAVDVELTPDDLREIESALSTITVHGARAPEGIQQLSDY